MMVKFEYFFKIPDIKCYVIYFLRWKDNILNIRDLCLSLHLMFLPASPI